MPHNDALWRDAVKTLFDPCPAGWRVPKGGAGANPWDALTQSNAVWDSGSDDLPVSYTWPTAAGGVEARYPLQGWRTGRSAGGLSGLNSEGSVHTSTVSADYCTYRFCFTPSKIMNLNAGAPRTQAISVRCVRE